MGKPVRKGKVYKRGVRRNFRTRGRYPDKDSGQNWTRMYSSAPIPSS